MKEVILSREEVMRILKIGRTTFYRLYHTNKIKGYKEGNRIKIPVSSVEEYINKKMDE